LSNPGKKKTVGVEELKHVYVSFTSNLNFTQHMTHFKTGTLHRPYTTCTIFLLSVWIHKVSLKPNCG